MGSSFVTFLFDVVGATMDGKVEVENDGVAAGAGNRGRWLLKTTVSGKH